jgi:hypothetical protein
MTLIISAICKDGLFIRSDKRRMVKDAGSVQIFDDMEKVFIHPGRKIIIYNHGINMLNGQSWRDLAIKSANNIWLTGAKDIDAALIKIEDTISADVLSEISNNQFANFCAFVVILKTRSKKWEAGEISWGPGQDVRKSCLGRFVFSGSGSKYLRTSNKQKEDSYWASIRMSEAKTQIGHLYTIALANQSNDHGNEFSSTYDDVMIL